MQQECQSTLSNASVDSNCFVVRISRIVWSVSTCDVGAVSAPDRRTSRHSMKSVLVNEISLAGQPFADYSMDAYEKDVIQEALNITKGSRSKRSVRAQDDIGNLIRVVRGDSYSWSAIASNEDVELFLDMTKMSSHAPVAHFAMSSTLNDLTRGLMP